MCEEAPSLLQDSILLPQTVKVRQGNIGEMELQHYNNKEALLNDYHTLTLVFFQQVRRHRP